MILKVQGPKSPKLVIAFYRDREVWEQQALEYSFGHVGCGMRVGHLSGDVAKGIAPQLPEADIQGVIQAEEKNLEVNI